MAANSFIATGGDGFTVFKEASATQETLGSDLDALEAYVGNQQSFGIPPDFGQRITGQISGVLLVRFRGRVFRDAPVPGSFGQGSDAHKEAT